MTRLYRSQSRQRAIREEYVQHTVRAYYEKHGNTYRNPHEPQVKAAILEGMRRLARPPGSVLDLACGSGEATLALVELGWAVHGVDPYTGNAYRERTRLEPEEMTFEDVAAGRLAGRSYDLVVCSYAMHLVEESRLPLLCHRLSEISPELMIVSPHKRPLINNQWGWSLIFEFIQERVHVRAYHKLM